MDKRGVARKQTSPVKTTLTSEEIGYLESQQIARLATIGSTGEPHVVPVGFRYNHESGAIEVGGPFLKQTKKYRDAARDGRVALVIDDLVPPWQPRGIEVRGRAEIRPEGGRTIHPDFEPELIRITPTSIATWGLGPEDSAPNSR